MNKKIKRMLLLELGILFLVLIIFFMIQSEIFTLLPPCIIHKTFGILCPSCQGTRCVINFLAGDFSASFAYHPVFFITILYFIIVNVIFIINSFRKKDILTFLYPTTKFWIMFLVVIVIFTILRNIL